MFKSTKNPSAPINRHSVAIAALFMTTSIGVANAQAAPPKVRIARTAISGTIYTNSAMYSQSGLTCADLQVFAYEPATTIASVQAEELGTFVRISANGSRPVCKYHLPIPSQGFDKPLTLYVKTSQNFAGLVSGIQVRRFQQLDNIDINLAVLKP